MSPSEQAISSAIEAVKQQRPDIWTKMKENEAEGHGHADIDNGIYRIIKEAAKTKTLRETGTIFFELRKAARRELGLPT